MAAGTTRYRVTLLLLGLLFVGVVVATVLVLPSGQATSLPDQVQRVSPANGEFVLRQTELLVQMLPGYRAHITANDVAIPDNDVGYSEPTGIHVFIPGPGKAFEEWPPGFVIVDIVWDTVSGIPDPGSMRWTFRTA